MRSPECPRCGYDLSGKLESYRESCPLEDMCSECGCEFAWRAVIGGRACPAWFVEHEKRPLLKTAAGTSVMLFRPHRWWCAVFMEYEPRIGRAALFAMLIYLCAGLFTSTTLAVEAWRGSGAVPGIGYLSPDVKDAMAARVGGGLLFPLAERWFDLQYYSNLPYNRFALNSWQKLTPLDHLGVVPALHNVVIVVASLATPLMFLVPVHTRERYKIRTAHIVRIGLYGFAGAVVLCVLMNVGNVIVFQLTDFWLWWGPAGIVLPIVPFAVASIWTTVWWSAAARHYLRIRGYRSFAWPLVGTGMLAGFTGQIVLAFATMDPGVVLRYIPGGGLF